MGIALAHIYQLLQQFSQIDERAERLKTLLQLQNHLPSQNMLITHEKEHALKNYLSPLLRTTMIQRKEGIPKYESN